MDASREMSGPRPVPRFPAAGLPSALDLAEWLRSPDGPAASLFLDYDGTLTPIVAEPRLAVLRPDVRDVIQRVAERWPVAVVSGRDLDDVRDLVGLPGLVYAGSHGLEITGPDGWHEERGTGAIPALDRAEARLRRTCASIPGVVIERKRLALAVHHRLAAPDRIGEIERAVAAEVADRPDLKRIFGRAVLELRPNIDWDKGAAVLRILAVRAGSAGNHVPVYLGDDLTDEDAFVAIRGMGIGVLVGHPAWVSSATHSLRDPQEVLAFLRSLATDTVRAPEPHADPGDAD